MLSKREEEEEKEKPMSVLEGDKKFMEKILSRNSSVGDHGHVSQHYRIAGEVPFQWESMPGTPQNLSSGENIITRARLKLEEYEEEEEEEEGAGGEEADMIRALRPPPVEEGTVGRRWNNKLPMPFNKSRFWKKNLWSGCNKFHHENEEENNNNNNNNNKNNHNSYLDDDNESFKFFDDAHSHRPSASKSSNSSSSSSSSSSYSSSFLPSADDHHDAMCTHHHHHHRRISKACLGRLFCKSGI